MTAPILIIDDEAAIRRLLRGALERGGWQAEEAATAADGLAAVRRPGCEVVLLDLGLPDRDGMELIPLIKAADRAVIVLTARDATAEKVAALDLGADDYVTKPFDIEELLARIRTALRHRSSHQRDCITAGNISIDLTHHRATRNGQQVQLTRKEFGLAAVLNRNADRVVTHSRLLRAVWGDAHCNDVEYLRVALRSLRHKLESDPAQPKMI